MDLNSIIQRDAKLRMQCVVQVEKLTKEFINLSVNRASTATKVKYQRMQGRHRLYQIDSTDSSDEENGKDNQSKPKKKLSLNSKETSNSQSHRKPTSEFVAQKISVTKDYRMVIETINSRDSNTNKITANTSTRIHLREGLNNSTLNGIVAALEPNSLIIPFEVITISDSEEEVPVLEKISKNESSAVNQNNLPSPATTSSPNSNSNENQFFPDVSIESLNEEPEKEKPLEISNAENDKKLKEIVKTSRAKSRGKTTLLTDPRPLHRHHHGKRLATGGDSHLPSQSKPVGPKRKKQKSKLSPLIKRTHTPYNQSYSKSNKEALARNSSSGSLQSVNYLPASAQVKKVSTSEQPSQLLQTNKSSAPGPVKAKVTNNSRSVLLTKDFVANEKPIGESKKRKSPSNTILPSENLPKKLKLTNGSAEGVSNCVISTPAVNKLASKRNIPNGQRLGNELSEKTAETSSLTPTTNGNRSGNGVTEEELSFFGLQSATAQVSSFLQRAAALGPVPGCSQQTNNGAHSPLANSHAQKLVVSDLKPGILKYAGTCGGRTNVKTVRFSEELVQIRIIEPRTTKKNFKSYKLHNLKFRRHRSLSDRSAA